MAELRIKRVYAEPAKSDGMRVLVDRIWPRGLSKKDAALDEWLKEIAPSDSLRKWFGHDPERWEEFRKRYCQELEEHGEDVAKLRELASRGRVTLLFAARDETHNNAVVLCDFLQGHRKPAALS